VLGVGVLAAANDAGKRKGEGGGILLPNPAGEIKKTKKGTAVG